MLGRRGRLQRPLLVKLIGTGLVAPAPKLKPEGRAGDAEDKPAERTGREAARGAEAGQEEEAPADAPETGGDEAGGEVENALVHITIGLYRALAAEVAEGFAVHALSGPGRGRADRAELAAQPALELDATPDPAALRNYWHRLGRLDDGVLWPPEADAALHLLGQRGQGYREVIALATAAQAFQVCSGAVTYKETSQNSATRDRKSDASLDIKDLIGKLGTMGAGALAGSVVGIGESAIAGVGTGLLVWLLGGAAWTFTSTRQHKSERTLNYTFLRDRSIQTLDRDLPVVIERIRAAGLAPVFVIDEARQAARPRRHDRGDHQAAQAPGQRLRLLLLPHRPQLFRRGRAEGGRRGLPARAHLFRRAAARPAAAAGHVRLYRRHRRRRQQHQFRPFVPHLGVRAGADVPLQAAFLRSTGRSTGWCARTAASSSRTRTCRRPAGSGSRRPSSLPSTRCWRPRRSPNGTAPILGFAQLAIDALYHIIRCWQSNSDLEFDIAEPALRIALLDRRRAGKRAVAAAAAAAGAPDEPEAVPGGPGPQPPAPAGAAPPPAAATPPPAAAAAAAAAASSGPRPLPPSPPPPGRRRPRPPPAPGRPTPPSRRRTPSLASTPRPPTRRTSLRRSTIPTCASAGRHGQPARQLSGGFPDAQGRAGGQRRPRPARASPRS